MFTGIVEETGTIVALDRKEGVHRIQVRARVSSQETKIGDSISLNGVCLTAVEVRSDALAFDAVQETLNRSNLVHLAVGSTVNLERAVRAGQPVGGHYVQGHIDSTVRLAERQASENTLDLVFDGVPERFRPHLVEKGFVAVDGVSLTIVGRADDRFWVTIVPHTRESVTIGGAAVGYRANLEVDLMAKLVDRTVSARLRALEARLAALETSR